METRGAPRSLAAPTSQALAAAPSAKQGRVAAMMTRIDGTEWGPEVDPPPVRNLENGFLSAPSHCLVSQAPPLLHPAPRFNGRRSSGPGPGSPLFSLFSPRATTSIVMAPKREMAEFECARARAAVPTAADSPCDTSSARDASFAACVPEH
ncbi:hypothetical protein PAL_GLEAN10002947 [Pteropus alecto]|uniref:Uncharacterized protein n=1 Tax=Pteropus alecto TaxID=9402 RepID=L5JYJ6_PTEAL|nr:hypothetical protein PAL_GLEAN10002947 [Pteropus alecto]